MFTMIKIYIIISTLASVRPYVGVPVLASHYQFLLPYNKMSQRKIAWYVLRGKIGILGHTHNPGLQVTWCHVLGQGEAELCISKLTSAFHHLPSVSPKQLCALAHLGCIRKTGTS